MGDRFGTVDDYIASFPEGVGRALAEVRQTIRAAVPTSAEKISYQMPTVTLDGKYLVYFAAWECHVGLYPVPPTEGALERELAPYRSGKATIRFPLGEPVPRDLIERLVAFLVAQRAADNR